MNKMSKFQGYSRFLMWFMALLLSVLAAGCGGGGGGGRDPILGLSLPALVSIAVTPIAASIPITGTKQFTATAIYSDGSSRDVTAASTWAPGTPAVALVGPATGLATGLSGGTSLITATFGGMSDSKTLTVTTAASLSFVVRPATASVPVTGTQQFAAIETFSDGSTQDRTTTSAWTSVDVVAGTGVASLSADGANGGNATGLKVGTSLIHASFPIVGPTLVATPATLTVNLATSVKFEVKPSGVAPDPLVSIPVTGTQQYAAIETFSNGTTFDRTTASAWTAPDLVGGLPVATLSADGASGGLVTGKVVGTSHITAAFGVYVGAVGLAARTATLTVTNATVLSIIVTPDTVSIPLGGTQKYKAFATLSDGSPPLDVTSNSGTLWTFVTPGIATFVQATGIATGAALGTTNITAAFGGKTSAPVTLTVTPAIVPVVLALNLRSALNFGITARGGLTSTGVNVVNGDVALTPTPTCADATGAPANCAVNPKPASATGLTVNGSMYFFGDTDTPPGATASAALFDVNLAWQQGMAMADTVPVPGVSGGGVILAGQLGGKTFLPGVYSVPALALNLATGTTATFDATGSPDPATASWIIKVGSSFTDSGIAVTPTEIKLAGGALARNIWFVVQVDASMGIGTTWNGNILAGRAITMTNNSIVNGRMLAGGDPSLAPGAQSVSLSGGIAPGTIITVPQ